MLGCGNSTLSEEMYYDGYEDIVNVDFSRVVVDQMKDKYKAVSENLHFSQMDVSDMPFEDAEFDCAIDKGTLDCVFCGDLALKKVRKVSSRTRKHSHTQTLAHTQAHTHTHTITRTNTRA